MDDQIRIAANRRGEMGIAPQVEAEVPEIFRRVDGLALRAQDHLIDELFVLGVAYAGEDGVELGGLELRAARQRNLESAQKLP